MIYWFTGQPGSGKTVLANLLKDKFLPHAFRIDGDEMRDLFSNKDYSIKGRVANIDAAQKISHYLHNQGKDVIVSLVSPYLDQREEFKTLLDWQIKEIYVHYDNKQIKRGREKYHVINYSPPSIDYLNVNTTKDSEIESIIKIASKLKL
jgi:adenylylsulfate kinase-like enzyme|tara:strand:+ start:684 stop:1130 length:447 start_codon:yes stop_codon:yes gene_type:complete